MTAQKRSLWPDRSKPASEERAYLWEVLIPMAERNRSWATRDRLSDRDSELFMVSGAGVEPEVVEWRDE